MSPGLLLRWKVVSALAALAMAVVAGLALRRGAAPAGFAVAVSRGPLVVTIAEAGTLRPAEAVTYRSRVPGRELEILSLAAEGQQVREGDVVVRLDTAELEVDLDRAVQALRQAQLDVQVADAERQAAGAALGSLSNGKGALDTEEARFNVNVAEQKVRRLKADYDSLAPLLDKGYVTRDELDRAASELQEAEGALELARRRAAVVTEQSVPEARQRAELDVAHRTAQREVARQRLADANLRVTQLKAEIEACTIRAQHAGLIVYEENLSSNPQRKVRAGDRVTPSQGLVTIPEVRRMVADTSLREADLHRVKPGQPATIRLEAYPEARLSGRVRTVGTVARVAPDRPFDGKRFDVVVDIDPNDVDLRPEMTARVEIRIADRADALLVPVNAVFDESGRAVVHVVGSRGIETRPVVLGQSNDTFVEVLHGLRAGERVRLSDGAADAARPHEAGGAEPGSVVAQSR